MSSVFLRRAGLSVQVEQVVTTAFNIQLGCSCYFLCASFICGTLGLCTELGSLRCLFTIYLCSFLVHILGRAIKLQHWLKQWQSLNIAGFDFGCTTDGTCDLSSTTDPGSSGIAQMKHFVTDDGLNAFRLPVAWPYLVNNKLGGTLDATNFGHYDDLMQGCLSGGPTNAQFASLWSQLATKYKSNSKGAFGIINEPHDVDITSWATSVQAAVTAIRKAGATNQKILLPGTDYTSAGAFISNGSGDALEKVTNLDGSTTNLIFDVHKYLDSDNSGTSAECTTNNVEAFTALGNWLRKEKRQAMLTETGGGSSASSCEDKLCQELATLNQYSDVFLGWLGWAAGMFDPTYTLSETPTQSGGGWTDQPLVKKCIVGQFTG